MPLRFLGLSTGRAGSYYFAKLLDDAGVRTLHEDNAKIAIHPQPPDALGEVSAHFVTQVGNRRHDMPAGFRIWHFFRHPQPFVSSLMKFGFWNMNAPSIHPYLRRTGDLIADSFLYWVDWNRRILKLDPAESFRIEYLDRTRIADLATSIGVEADITKIAPVWNEKQEFAEIPADVAGEVHEMMWEIGYDQA